MCSKQYRFFTLILYLISSFSPLFADAPPIKIGVLTDLSGKAAYLGQQTRIGSEIAAAEINADGEKLKLVFGDHGFDTAKAVSEAQKLLNIDSVQAIFSNFSGPSRAVSPVVLNAKRLFIYTAAAVSPVKDNQYAFKSYIDYSKGCALAAESWKASGMKKIGLLKAESEFGELCETGIKTVYPDPFIASYKISEEVSTQALLFKSKKIEGVLNVGYEGDFSNMLKSFGRLQYYPKISGNEDIFTKTVMKDFSAALEGSISFGMPQPEENFNKLVKDRDSRDEVNAFDQAGTAYLHVRQMYDAIKECKENDIDCQVKKVAGAKADPRFGFENWAPDRQAVYHQVLKVVKAGELVLK